jgi:hypothetical protein
MGTLANVDVNVKVDNKTIIIIGVTIFFAVLVAVIVAKKV